MTIENKNLEEVSETKNEQVNTVYSMDDQEALYDSIMEDKAKAGELLYGDDEDTSSNDSNEDETPEIEIKVEEKSPVEVKDDYKELLNQLKADREADRAELAQLREEIKHKEEKSKEVLVPKKDRSEVKQERLTKVKAAFSLIGNGGDVLEAENLIAEALSNDNEFSQEDIEEITSKKASAIANQVLEQYKIETQANNDLVKVTNDFYAKNKDLDNPFIENLWNEEARKIAISKDGSSLTVEGLYKKALENTKVILKGLGVNQVPHASNDEAERKARLEKAKNATVKQNSSSKSPTKAGNDDEDGEVTEEFIWESFLKTNVR